MLCSHVTATSPIFTVNAEMWMLLLSAGHRYIPETWLAERSLTKPVWFIPLPLRSFCHHFTQRMLGTTPNHPRTPDLSFERIWTQIF